MRRLAAAALMVAGVAGCGAEDKKFLSERRAEAAGYRLEYFERDKVLFVHRPNGEKNGAQFADLRRVLLHRIKAKDSNDGKPKYWWLFDTGKGALEAPFFGTEPKVVVEMLRAELPAFDEATALKMSAAFGKDRASSCLVWISDRFLAEMNAKRESECKP
jgi:hypothetical protein